MNNSNTNSQEYRYDENYYVKNGYENFETQNRNDHDEIIKLGNFKPTDYVLDIGCGFGTLLSKIPTKYKFGTESNEFAVKRCNEKSLNVIKHDDCYHLPYNDNYFDVIIMNEVIEHINNASKALNECHRILKPSGKIIITTPNKTLFSKELSPTHVSEMSFSNLNNIVIENNFEIKKHLVSGVNIWDFIGRNFIYKVAKWLKRLGLLTTVINNTRSQIDNASISQFRDRFLYFGSQQILVAKKLPKRDITRLNVSIIFFKYPLYQDGSYIQEFIDELCTKSESVLLFASRYPKGDFDKPKNLKINWVTLPNIPIIGDIIFNLEIIFKAIFSNEFKGIDVINVISARGAPAGYLLSKIFNKPIINTIEIINPDNTTLLDKVFHTIQKFLYKLNYDKTICWSDYYSHKYLNEWGIKQSKIKIIPAGINTNRFNNKISGNEIKQKYSPNDILIVFAKPLYTYNRISAELLLESVNLLRDKIKINILLGDGEERNLIEEKITDLDMQDTVTFMPFVSINEIPKYIAASDIIVLPYTYPPTTSRSLLECLAIAKPIVTTNLGEIPYLIENNEHALIVNPDKAEIANAILKLINNPTLATHLGRNALSLINQKYTVQHIVDETVKIYNNIISKGLNKNE